LEDIRRTFDPGFNPPGPTGLDLNLVGAPYFGEKGESLSEEALNQKRDLEEKAAKINAYFADKNLPAAGLGMKMVLEANKNGLDWRLLPSLIMVESTALKFPCPNDPENGFGWASCKYVDFESTDHAIEVVAANLGGNNPKTAHYYKDKDLDGILRSYNSVNPKYNGTIKSIMKTIENYDIS
jgi:hypothetical protein